MTVHYEIADHIATFTIDNGKHNFMNIHMYEEMTNHLVDFESNNEVKVGLLRGRPGSSFCAGDDLKARPRPLDVTPHWPTKMFTAPRSKPIVSAIDGWALGGGFQVAIGLSDLRIATHEAKLGAPEIAYGMGGIGGALRLTRHLPRTVALQMLLTGDYLTAHQAHRLHLVNQVVDVDQLEVATRSMAERIAVHPRIAITTELRALNECEDLDVPQALDRAGALYRAQIAEHEKTSAYADIVPSRPTALDLGLGPGR